MPHTTDVLARHQKDLIDDLEIGGETSLSPVDKARRMLQISAIFRDRGDNLQANAMFRAALDVVAGAHTGCMDTPATASDKLALARHLIKWGDPDVADTAFFAALPEASNLRRVVEVIMWAFLSQSRHQRRHLLAS